MTAAGQAAARDADVRLRIYVGALAAVAVAVAATVAAHGPTSGQPISSPWVLIVLWAATVAARSARVGMPVRGVGGVGEETSLLEIVAVLLMVLLDPAWAVGLAVTATVVVEGRQRLPPRKVVFNTASEALAVSLGGAGYHALAGPQFAASPSAIGVALLATVIYIGVNLATFTGLVAVLSGDARDAVRSPEMRSSLLVSLGVGATGVLAAVLLVEAPWALPLIAVPTVLDHVRAGARQESLELAAAKDAAETANVAKSEFLLSMSHELRTPLNAVLGFGQLLEADDRLPEDAKENVSYIMRSGRHLLDIIGEVLDLSQIEAGRLTLELASVNLTDAVRETVDMVRPLAAERHIRTRLDLPDDADTIVAADPKRLRQVLLNLLSNAIKYNREEGTVTVTVQGAAQGISIAIADTGRGIPADDIDRAFAPFDRLDAGSTRTEGTGLGLPLSRNFIEAMGGRLEASSDVGVGSTFTVILPRADQPVLAS